jgi:hypothetical protein
MGKVLGIVVPSRVEDTMSDAVSFVLLPWTAQGRRLPCVRGKEARNN